jgi:hypothetical protein
LYCRSDFIFRVYFRKVFLRFVFWIFNYHLNNTLNKVYNDIECHICSVNKLFGKLNRKK